MTTNNVAPAWDIGRQRGALQAVDPTSTTVMPTAGSRLDKLRYRYCRTVKSQFTIM